MIPLPWGSISVVAVLMASSFYMGFRFEAGRFEAYRTKIEAEAKYAKQKLDEAVKQHEEISKQISHDYQTELVELHSYYSRLLDDGASRGGVSTVSKAARCPDGAPAPKPVPVVTQRCAETALRLKELQHWIQQMQR